jgi:hypothetical protein
MIEVRCKVCDAGTMRRRQVHRNNGRLVDIGYVLLAPSIPALVICTLSFVSLPAGNLWDNSSGLPGDIFLLLALGAFASAILGWTLIKKKDIFVCPVCKAVSEPGTKRTTP